MRSEENEIPSRHTRGGGYGSYVSGFYTLLHKDELSAYVERLALLCNNPSQFVVRVHEISSEPKTKIPKVFLSYAERVKTKHDQWTTFCYEIMSKVFDDTQDSLDEYSQFLKDVDEHGWHVLQNHRFYEVDPETQTSYFRMIVIFAKKKEQEIGAAPSRVGENQDGRCSWGGVIPVKVTY